VLGDRARRLRPGMSATIPFVGSRFKVDVVDADSKLLDEAEAPRPDRRPGSGDQSGTTTSTGGPPWAKRPSRRPCPTTSLRHGQQRNPASAAASRTRRDSRKNRPCDSTAGALVGLAATAMSLPRAGACAGYESVRGDG